MSDDIKAQESAKEGDDKVKSGEKDTVSKIEFEKINAKVEGLAKKNEELISILTSPAFMARREPPPVVITEPKEVPPTDAVVDGMSQSQLLNYTVAKMGKMLDAHDKKQKEVYDNVAASIQKMVETDEDREAQRQIKKCIKDYGQEEFDAQREKMVELAGAYPGISADDCYLLAVGKKNPPVKKPVPNATGTEKPGQSAAFKESNLTPDAAAEKAFEITFGGKEKV